MSVAPPVMALGKAEICRLLPHAASMCLLDSVDAWDAAEIRCTAVSHRDPANPLRLGDRLPAACGVEYAAQAAGVHGRLLARQDSKPAAGFLASLRDLRLYRDRLDDIAEALRVHVRKLADAGDSVMCEFDIRAADQALLSGRLTLLLDAR